MTGFKLPDGSTAQPDAPPPPAWVQALVARVQLHLCGQCQDFTDVPYDFAAVGAFARRVYEATLNVGAGRTCSYGDIARRLGQGPAGARAVGVALGGNPWPLLVPCHRVVAADGHMTGFSGPGGIKTKLKLLALEGAQLFAD